MVENVDCAVIGAGVIGLAVARALSQRGRDVVVLEAAGQIGTEISSRNSEVIHAGIYYTPGSLKARSCVGGRDALYRYAALHGVAHRRCGKLIVATAPDQLPGLAAIRSQAAACGVHDLRSLSAEEARELEPAVRCIGAVLSPSTGIIDSHGFMLALQGDAEAQGAMIAFHSRVVGGRMGPREKRLEVATEAGGMTLAARAVVNATGLHAPPVARSFDGLPPALIPGQFFAKGSYFMLAGRSPFQHLVYPLPSDAYLGLHVTLDLAGAARFGPDHQWIERIDYDVDPGRAEIFYAAIREYYPALADGALLPGYAGIRPKIHAPGTPAPDFGVQGPGEHGIPGLVNLFGIESPGLTSALPLADTVADLLEVAP
ncbi:MAG: NAD(P)/FAD-dependent oxidoreductase [Alphaproteobacteria bacterium]|nr:NAD(P)/FAD-dependent oxidoreductase [Alphaproteobacteria bacterium]